MIDQLIIGLYLIITLIIGLCVGRNTKNIKDFAVGQRNFSTIVLVLAVFASVVDANDTIGLASNAFSVGPIFIISYMGIVFSRFTLAFFVAPKMHPFLDCISCGDIFERIYGRRAKTLMGFSTLIESTLMAGAQILAISHTAQYFFGISGEIAAISTALLIIIYSFRGGIKSVTATDVFQFAIIIIAIPFICGLGISTIGYDTFFSTLKTTGFYFKESEAPNYGHHIAVFISLALPCLYPLCIQRMLMAKDVDQIKTTFIANGLLSIPFYLIVGMIGITAFILIPEADPHLALPNLISHLLPAGIRGFVIAGLLAVFMSTLDSILNIGAIAITHDLIGSLVDKPLSSKVQLSLVRVSSVIIAIGAVLIALRFTNVLDIFFILMVIGNSIFFPGYLLGITGLNASPRGFWAGVFAGFITVIFCILVLDMYPLYVMLLAISTNSIMHLIDNLITKKSNLKIKCSNWLFIKKITWPNFIQKLTISGWVKNQEYCNIFAFCSIGISLFPFFAPKEADANSINTIFVYYNVIIASLSFILLFRDIWRDFFIEYFPLLWSLTIILALPVQSIFMLIQTNFSLAWLVDAIVIIPLLAVITNKNAAIFSCIFGLIISIILSIIIPPSPSAFILSFGYWSLVLHIIVLALCLALFRKRDVDMCRFASSILVHEAKRSLSTFENVAKYYQQRLPILISAYKISASNNKNIIPLCDLETMLSLPIELERASVRTKNTITTLFGRVSSNSSSPALQESCNIKECISIAIQDPSIIDNLKNIVLVDEQSELQVLGDRDQLVQMFINILENAYHALVETAAPKIHILINGQIVLIKDNGKGVDEIDRPRIFDEFFSTKSTSGQGLAYCKHVMLEHKGHIKCRSKKGYFTEFELRFPLLKKRGI